MKSFLFSIFALSIFFAPLSAYGQLGLTPNYADELVINVSPTYPAPGDSVTVSLEMYTENLNTSAIAWYRDGKLVQQGTGKTSYTLTAPQAGRETRVSISITTRNGVSFSKSVLVRPATIDLLWEGNSYTPPFYKGRALWSAQGYLHIQAVPSFGDPAKLVYTWKVNDEVIDQSGYGKDYVSIYNDGLGGRVEIQVFATDPATDTAAQSILVVAPVEPSIVFYENNPLYGIVYDRAISSVDLDRSEMSVIASPFNLFASFATDIDYKWRVNGNLTEAFGRTITLRKPESGSGQSNITLQANNTKKLMQFAESGFLVKFK